MFAQVIQADQWMAGEFFVLARFFKELFRSVPVSRRKRVLCAAHLSEHHVPGFPWRSNVRYLFHRRSPLVRPACKSPESRNRRTRPVVATALEWPRWLYADSSNLEVYPFCKRWREQCACNRGHRWRARVLTSRFCGRVLWFRRSIEEGEWLAKIAIGVEPLPVRRLRFHQALTVK